MHLNRNEDSSCSYCEHRCHCNLSRCVCAKTIQPSADIWVAFGTGKSYTLYSIFHICASLGYHKSQALPVFNAFTGCDTISSFRGKGKKSAWNAWQACDDVTETFIHLACNHLRFSTLILTIFKC